MSAEKKEETKAKELTPQEAFNQIKGLLNSMQSPFTGTPEQVSKQLNAMYYCINVVDKALEEKVS